jgi:hypothetical protein
MEKPPADATGMDLLYAREAFYLENLPFKSICDVEIPSGFPGSTVFMRRYSAKFENLTPDQTSKLKRFIQKHGRI